MPARLRWPVSSNMSGNRLFALRHGRRRVFVVNLSERVPEQLSPAGLEEPNKARQALRSTRQRSKNLLWGKHAQD